MLKKYYLAFFLLIYFSKSYASFWGEVGECLSDPCNCGYNKIDETWNGSIKRTIKPNPICPPWNRRDGRDTDNCLIQFDPPEKFIGFYLHHCAERTPESSYFAPKIRIRTQSCNAFACWNQSTTLNWDGECVIWPGAYALPLLRICARVAVPAVGPTQLNKEGTPADPGYTPGKHLNDVGFTEDDKPIVGDDGKPFNRPKLCAYSDPGLVNLVSATGAHLDPMDWNAVKQPLHKTDALHPLAKILKFLIGIKSTMSISGLLGKLLDMIGSDNTPGLDVIKEIVKWIGYIFEQQWLYEVAKQIVEALGALNRSVDNYQFGCVELPLGPFPPPYCPKLEQFIITPTTKRVCSKKKDGLFVQSSNAPCVVSKLRNNLMHNVVRVSLDNLVPLCKNGEDPQKTDKCVIINSPFASAKGLHIDTAQRDAIKKCSDGDAKFCVNTKIPFECSVTENGCEDGFRIVYAQKVGKLSTPSSYYVDDVPDCDSKEAKDKITCQEIWGINIGEFIDVNLAFPLIQGQDATSLLPLKKIFKLRDNVDDRSFVASITINTTLDTTLEPHLRRDPKSICVAEGKSLVGCEDRVIDGYQILTYQCEKFPGICLKNSYYTPQFIASIGVSDDKGNIVDSTNTVITPLSVTQSIAGKTEAIINLAGFNFTSFMAYISNTPSTIYTAMPFSGKKSMNPLTIYGNYKDDKIPYDAKTGIPTTGVVYLKGLEYINGKYIQGATHGCLQLKDIDKCIPGVNDTNCVLARLLESDTVDCSKFKTKSMQYLGLQICQDIHTDCNSVETIDDLKTKGITIYKCANSAYCYKNNRKLDVEVCKVSVDSNNRIDPSPSLGPTINTDGKYYTATFNRKGVLIDKNGTFVDKDGIPVDKDDVIVNENGVFVNKKNGALVYQDGTSIEKTAAIRDKTPQELGFCTLVPAPKCQAITTPTNASGNATWSSTEIGDPDTKIGDLALGTCKPGWVVIDPNKPLQRYCLSNIDTKTVAFEALPDGVGCKENTGLAFKYTSDFKSNFPVENSYDNATKVGTFVLGVPYDSAGHSPAHLIDTLHCANYEFDIPNTNKLGYFTVGGTGSYYDDYIVIKINNQLAHAGPTTSEFNSMQCRDFKGDNCVVYIYKTYQGKFVKAPDIYRYTNIPQLDLMSHLQNGKNNLNICVGVVGGGILNVTIKYQLK
ncbi:hypothetical protein [Candidatus Tisiphia endosymbiont of Nedyus quadrimaculatus]|uniref:hypothetical protein n=1 Tax=Candidatus Tisiphia endosymbiont of Nedyus quadrimaculatus TaxID=3139332 RepID=UPI00345F00A1